MEKNRHPAFTAALCLVLAAVAIAIAYSFLPKPGQGGEAQGGKIAIELRSAPYVEGSIATAHAVSTCGDFSLFLDGEKIGSGGAYADLPIALSQGGHLLFAQGGACNASFPFNVLARECGGGGESGCSVNGCAGTRRCENGIYTQCLLPRKICVPGERIGCSSDSCNFGYATCNGCGTGFGPCLPPGAGGQPCGGNSCS